MDAHDLIGPIKQLASDLGHSPTRSDAERSVQGYRRKLDRLFNGSHTALLLAAGLPTYDEQRAGGSRKLDVQTVFGRDIAEIISAHVPSREPSSTPGDFKPILPIGDTHFPFVHKPTLERIYRFAEKEQPAYIVQVGDLKDQWSSSRFPRSQNYYRPQEEMELARAMAVEFWTELKRACPAAQCYQILGNHDIRPLKQIVESAPALEHMIREGINKSYEFDGVKTIHDYREELFIQDIMFHHGYMTRHGQQRDFVQSNLVSGHTHRGAVTYRPIKDRTLWHLDCGFVGDAESKAMGYTPQKTTGWTLGWGWIDSYGPRFIPA